MPDQVADIITLWAPAVLLVLSIVNMFTKHYTKFNGVLRVVMAVIERLSFLASKHSRSKFKAPGTSVLPDPCAEKLSDIKEQFKQMARIKKARSDTLARRGKR